MNVCVRRIYIGKGIPKKIWNPTIINNTDKIKYKAKYKIYNLTPWDILKLEMFVITRSIYWYFK